MRSQPTDNWLRDIYEMHLVKLSCNPCEEVSVRVNNSQVIMKVLSLCGPVVQWQNTRLITEQSKVRYLSGPPCAAVAQLVECLISNQEVAGSSPVCCSIGSMQCPIADLYFAVEGIMAHEGRNPSSKRSRCHRYYKGYPFQELHVGEVLLGRKELRSAVINRQVVIEQRYGRSV